MLTVLLLFIAGLGVHGEEFTPLGRAIFLPDYDVMGKLEETGSEVLLSDAVKQCSVTTKVYMSKQVLSYFKDTKSFYSSIGTTSSLSAKLQADFSLGVTLDVNTKSISGSKRTVAGNSLIVMAQTYQTRIYMDCLQSPKTLNPLFLKDFEALPPVIRRPWMASDWAPYDMFLRKYGSHVISSTTYGSSINQMSFADSSESYNQNDFQVKSCVSLAGAANESQIGSIGVNACTDIDQSEINRVTSLTMSDTMIVRGGSPETRNELLIHRTDELIQKFMNEATTNNASIAYTFKSVWELLQILYSGAGTSNDNYIKAVNLEYYYLGYLNYGCKHSEYQTQQLQTFNFTKYHTPTEPQYECTLAPEGCHNDDSCHYKPIWCSCRGANCVSHHSKTLDTGEVKVTATCNLDSDWGWHGCHWKKGLAGSKCICRYPNNVRTVVWSLDKTSTYAMMRRRGRAAKQNQGIKQEL